MNKQKWIILLTALALMGGAAGLLNQLRSHQRLGVPAVKTSPISGTEKCQVDLPEQVAGYISEALPTDKIVLDTLPQDTSFGSRRYKSKDGFDLVLNVVLMGTDRTSLHKPEFCLEGQGWRVDQAATAVRKVRLDRPFPYDLSLMRLLSAKQVEINGQSTTLRGVYLYWFVAENQTTPHHWQRMWWMAKDLLRTGVLQRWAYVSCFAVCMPGQEEATTARMEKFLASSVPDFQLTPSALGKGLAARQ